MTVKNPLVVRAHSTREGWVGIGRGVAALALAAASLLATLACGGSAPAPVASASPAPTPVAATRPVPPPVRDAWAEWIQAHHHALRSTSATDADFSDVQFLKTAIGGRRLVQLGESGHGVAEFDSLKVRLVRFLHEEMGFDVIAFESGLYECFHADEMAEQMNADYLMRNSIFAVWYSDETLPLFEYIQDTRATSRPLHLVGFDTQFSTSVAPGQRAQDLHDLLAVIDPALAEEARTLDLELVRLAQLALADARVQIAPKADQMIADYTRIADRIDRELPRLKSAFPARPLYPLVMAQAMRTAPAEVRCLASPTDVDYGNIRDQAMADNVTFLLARMYPTQRIATWAHNYHVRYDGHAIDPTIVNMGSYLVQRHRADLYTIGLFMYWGQAAQNDRRVYPIALPSPNSLEALFGRTTPPASFVDLLGQTQSTDGTSWMFEAIPSKLWGVTDETQIHRHQYDGILFVDEVHPPHYR
jgi:erythromycin esterase